MLEMMNKTTSECSETFSGLRAHGSLLRFVNEVWRSIVTRLRRAGASGFGAAIVVGVMVTGCATPGDGYETDEARVKARAEARWAALIAGESEKGYSFIAPSQREILSFQRFQARFGSAARRESAEVVSVACVEERCEVTVRVDFYAPMRPRQGLLNTHVIERWVREQGQWWLFQRM